MKKCSPLDNNKQNESFSDPAASRNQQPIEFSELQRAALENNCLSQRNRAVSNTDGAAGQREFLGSLSDGATVEYAGSQYKIVSSAKHISRRKHAVQTLVLESAPRAIALEDSMKSPQNTTPNFGSCAARAKPQEFRGNTGGVITPIGVPKGLMTPGVRPAPLLVGFDTEWQETGDQGRRILSIQMSIRCSDGIERHWVLWHPSGVRFRISTVLGWFLTDLARWIGYSFSKPSVDDKNKPQSYHLTLAAHYGIVDFSVFYDKNNIMRNTDCIRGSLVSIQKPLFCNVWSDDRNFRRQLVVAIRDTICLSPNKSRLEVLGNAIQLPKLSLPDGFSKSEMGRLRDQRPDAFIAYAVRDAEIARRWIEQITLSFNAPVPTTLGGQAARMLHQCICETRCWTTDQFNYEWRGLTSIRETHVNARNKKVCRSTTLEPRPEAALILTAAGNAYYGGRNEGFLCGIHHADEGWSDFDLSGAYPTAMCLIEDPDYAAAPVPVKGQLIRGTISQVSWLFAHVRFRFPTNVNYPCLPIKDTNGRGLVFPLSGETWASAPELWLALEFGAEIELTQPAFILASHPKHKTLAVAMRRLLLDRKEAEKMYGKKSPQAAAAKERANSAYGKLAQGLAGKRVFSTRRGGTDSMPPSAVTSAPQAALTTGLVRAVVSAALHQLSRMGYRIASVTTDGFLTDAPKDVLDSLDLFGLRAEFAQAREYLVADETVWELKHKARSLVMLKTRGGFGVGMIDDVPLPTAAAGYRPSGATEDRVAELGKSEALAELFLKRKGKVGFDFHALPSPRDYVIRDADAIGHDVYKEVSWEWDYKREADESTVCTESVVIDGVRYEHVSYSTQPWKNIEEFDNARAVAAEQTEAVKTEADLRALTKRIKRRPAALKAGVRHRGGLNRSGAISVLRGLRSGKLTAPWYCAGIRGREVCQRVGAVFQVTLSESDWKNARRPDRSGHTLFEGLDEQLSSLDITILKSPVEPPAWADVSDLGLREAGCSRAHRPIRPRPCTSLSIISTQHFLSANT